MLKNVSKQIVLISCSIVFTITAQTSTLPNTLIDKAEVLQKVGEGYLFCEGPTYDSKNNLYFTDTKTETIWISAQDQIPTKFREKSNKANGLLMDAKDRLIACESNKITRTLEDGSIEILAQGDSLGGTNDICFTPDYGIFFTSPKWNDKGNVFFRDSSGKVKRVLKDIEGFPNGIEYVAESRTLYLAMTQKNQIWSFIVDKNMNLQNQKVFCNVTTPDGFALDENGNAWVASFDNASVVVISSEGKILGSIKITEQKSVQNCAFGGSEFKTLFIAGEKAVYKIKTLVKGKPTCYKETSMKKNSHSFQCSPKPHIHFKNLDFYTLLGRKFDTEIHKTNQSNSFVTIHPLIGHNAIQSLF